MKYDCICQYIQEILILIYLYIIYNLHMILILDRIILNMYLISSYIQHIMPIPTRPSSYNEYNNRIAQNVHKIRINTFFIIKR